MERYQHPLLAVRGTARGMVTGPGSAAGLSVEGPGVALSALRRRGDWLELRLVAEHPVPTEAVIRGPFREARTVDLLGREGVALPCSDALLRLRLGAWEIATVRLR
jgi:alpha-mannosidase